MFYRVIYISAKTMEAEFGTVREEFIRANNIESAEAKFIELVDSYDHIVKIEEIIVE